MGDGTNPATAYDANGNIRKMVQSGRKGTTSPVIDNLTYSYEGNGNYNKLQSVTDGANDPTTTLGDFKEVTTGGTIDYLYDYNGNLRKDHNKQIDSIRYNHLNLPEHIHILGKGNIAYLYDAAGIKHRKVVTDSTDSPVKVTTTDYIGGLVYQQDSLQFASHEEGRIRAVYATGQPVEYSYDYFLKDHLGNVRTVLTTGEQETATYLASMETETAAKETALFSNIEATRTDKPTGYPQDATTDQNSFVAKLNANNPDKKIGPSLVLRVMAGDTIQLGAKAFYKSQQTPQNKQSAPPQDMLSALISAFGSGQTPGGQGHGAGISGTANNTPFNNDFNNAYQRLKDKDNDASNPGRPKAYLNFVLFDEQFNLVEGNSGVKQVQATPDELQTLAQGKMVMEKSGFLYVYTSNESPQDVFFDNVVVMSTPGPVMEETHYYPYGLTMAGISTRAVGKLENRYKYNGIEKIGDLGLEDYDAKFRELDPQLGRWWQVDPKIESMEMWSPYASNYNNPIRFSDFLGDEPDDEQDQEEPKKRDIRDYDPFALAKGGVYLSRKKAETPEMMKRRAGFIVGLSLAMGGIITASTLPEILGLKFATDKGGKLRDDALNTIKSKISSLQKAQKSLAENVKSHLKKIEEFRKNPDKFDNKEILKGKSDEMRKKIIDGRIKALEKQVVKNQGELNKVNEQLKVALEELKKQLR